MPENVVETPNEIKRDVVPENVVEVDDKHAVEVLENVENLRDVVTEKVKGRSSEHYFLECHSMKEVPEKVEEHDIALEDVNQDAQTDIHDVAQTDIVHDIAQIKEESITCDTVNLGENVSVFNDPNDI